MSPARRPVNKAKVGKPLELSPIRCASCRRVVAYSPAATALRNKVYCDRWCANEAPVTPEQERNDQWRILVAHAVSPVRVARLYGVDHARVYRVVDKYAA